jgi:hypothetical protein
MKRAGWLGVMMAATLAQAAGRGDMLSLQVREGSLRASPSFLGRVTATAAYGDRFEVVARQGDWVEVRAPEGSARGWVHQSALTAKRIVLKGGEADAQVAASSGELALAGKGFNSDVEAAFREENRKADFATVDRMAAWKVTADEARAFLAAGGVAPEGGAR